MRHETEREYYRRKIAEKVTEVVGPLLDAWDIVPNDVKAHEELSAVAKHMKELDRATDAEQWPESEAYKPNTEVSMPGKMTIAEAVKMSREIAADLEAGRRAAADKEAAEHAAQDRHCAPAAGSAKNPNKTLLVDYRDHVTSHAETRPLAIIEGKDGRERWHTIFEVTEWDESIGSTMSNPGIFSEIRMRYPRRTS